MRTSPRDICRPVVLLVEGPPSPPHVQEAFHPLLGIRPPAPHRPPCCSAVAALPPPCRPPSTDKHGPAAAAHLSDMSQLSFLVLDEADRMVQQGHYQVGHSAQK